uniref:Uncharacterized protein n=1 Tax=Rhizophora mucronata TaxID=61149 RepID=A0A2P2NKX5_RHIMU
MYVLTVLSVLEETDFNKVLTDTILSRVDEFRQFILM